MKHKQPTTDELMDSAPAREMEYMITAVQNMVRVMDDLTSATWAVAHQQNHMINRLSVPEELLKACPWCKK